MKNVRNDSNCCITNRYFCVDLIHRKKTIHFRQSLKVLNTNDCEDHEFDWRIQYTQRPLALFTLTHILLVRMFFSSLSKTLQFFYCFPLSLSHRVLWLHFTRLRFPLSLCLASPFLTLIVSRSLTSNKYLPQMSPCAKFCLNGIVLNGARDIRTCTANTVHVHILSIWGAHSCHPSGPHIT